jgi:uncharacterized protein (DUF697 family)
MAIPDPFQIFKFVRQLTMNKRDKADEIIKTQVAWAAGAGLVPLPLVDIAAVTAVQVSLVKQLADLYEVSFEENTGKALIAGLASSSLASVGASFVKAIPFVGGLLGGASMALLSGGATYAVGQVFVRHFESGGTMESFDIDSARRTYDEEFERGKEFVRKVRQEGGAFTGGDVAQSDGRAAKGAAPVTVVVTPDDAFAKLDKLSQLFSKGVLTDAEYAAKKQEILDSIH